VNIERLRWGEWIAAIAGLDLALVTFRAWYKVSGTGAKVTGWDALTNGRILLIATAVAGVFLLLVIASEQSELPFPPGVITAVVGLACSAYIVYRLASPPSDSADPDVGIYIGLAGAIGVFVGGVLSAREGAPGAAYEPAAAAAAAEPEAREWEQGATTPPEFGGPGVAAPAAGGWSPAAPAPSTGTWSPAAPAPAATAAGGAQPGEEIVLTAGGARFPAGTRARVVQTFAGGALVEVVAADGVAERFEVPDAAYERAGAGVAEPPTEATAPATSGETWSPAMPSPAPGAEDWGFDEGSAQARAAAAPGEAVGAPAEEAAQPAEKKVPWYKREIGGGKKKAASAAPEAEAAGEERPGFFKRLFGGGKASEAETEVVGEGDGWAPIEGVATDAPPSEPAAEPEPVEPGATGVPVAEPETEPAPVAPPVSPEPEPEPEPEPAASAEPEPAAEPEPPAPAEAAVEPAAPPEAEAPAAADPGAAAAAAEPRGGAEEPGADDGAAAESEAPKKPRRRSSASRKVPKEALAAVAAPPKVGDEVELKIGGGRWDAGTRGTVVDVFSAGVIVELADDSGHTERLDLPFEAVGPPADANA
jgi:hypothetical protein